MKIKNKHVKIYEYRYSVFGGKCIVLNTFFGKEERSYMNNVHFKNRKKISRRKNIIENHTEKKRNKT